MAGFKFAVSALLMCVIIPGLATGHENPDCSFVDEAGKVEGLKVAEQALTALSSVDLVAPHHTVFLPNDKAFTSLIAALNTTAKELLSFEVLQNKTLAILTYHVLQPEGIYLADDLVPPLFSGPALFLANVQKLLPSVSNKTLPTLLGELTDKPYPLSFLREIEGTKSVRIRGAASNATIVGESTKICEREVHIIDTVLLPGMPANIPSNLPALFAAKMNAARAAEAPNSEGDNGMPTAAPSSATTNTVNSVLLASIAAAVAMAAL